MNLVSFRCSACGNEVDYAAQSTFDPDVKPKLCLRCADVDPFHQYKTRNFAVRELGFSTYREYLKSDLWQTIRASILNRDDGRCVCCHEPAQNVHHQSYAVEALVGKATQLLHSLCRDCHYAIEFDINGDKFPIHRSRRILRRALKRRVPAHTLDRKP